MSTTPRRAVLVIDAWYGREGAPVEIIKETPKRFLVRCLRDGTLFPGGRRAAIGQALYVSKAVVREETTL